jgi:hypothetical protein
MRSSPHSIPHSQPQQPLILPHAPSSPPFDARSPQQLNHQVATRSASSFATPSNTSQPTCRPRRALPPPLPRSACSGSRNLFGAQGRLAAAVGPNQQTAAAATNLRVRQRSARPLSWHAALWAAPSAHGAALTAPNSSSSAAVSAAKRTKQQQRRLAPAARAHSICSNPSLAQLPCRMPPVASAICLVCHARVLTNADPVVACCRLLQQFFPVEVYPVAAPVAIAAALFSYMMARTFVSGEFAGESNVCKRLTPMRQPAASAASAVPPTDPHNPPPPGACLLVQTPT